MCSSGSVFLPPSPGNSPPLERSSRSSCSSVGSSTHEGEGSFKFGAPLRRMVPIESLDSSTSSWENFENDDEEEPWVSSPESSLSLSNFVELEAMVDEYLSRYQDCEIDHNIIVIEKSQDARETMHPPQSVMILRLPPDSSELKILRFLNSDPVREDPWNPGPRVLHLSERENVTVVCMERLFEYDQPPLQTIANIVDFVRQQLEGLSFLHEHRIAHRAYEDTTSIMVDLGPSTHEGFDRVIYPVRYYRVDFSLAEQMGINTSPRHPAFIQDIQACGRMFLRLMPEVPNIQKKLKSLAAAMVGGGYSAADARKLFEALCRTVDSKTYEALLVSGALKGVTP